MVKRKITKEELEEVERMLFDIKGMKEKIEEIEKRRKNK